MSTHNTGKALVPLRNSRAGADVHAGAGTAAARHAAAILAGPKRITPGSVLFMYVWMCVCVCMCICVYARTYV